MFGVKKLKKLLQKHEEEMDQAQLDVLPFDENTIRRAIQNMTDEELEKALAAVEQKIAELEEKEK